MVSSANYTLKKDVMDMKIEQIVDAIKYAEYVQTQLYEIRKQYEIPQSVNVSMVNADSAISELINVIKEFDVNTVKE